jgi:NADPH-dependent 7-cyano-7-deazaguanine reductase QueF-like protein
MASGLEVVGLALAVFPILVEGLKFYADKKGRVRDFIHYRHLLKRIVRDLSREQISFQNSSQLFLENISMHYGLSSNDIQEMMQNPQDARWRKGIPFQSDYLIEKSVAIYLETVEDMNEVLIKIQDTVGIREGAQVSRCSFDFWAERD